MKRLSILFLALVLLASAAACDQLLPRLTATAGPLGGDETLIKKFSSQIKLTTATDFTLEDQNGNRWSLSDLKGKIVLLNFWATWCGPCQAEMPEFQKLYDRFGTEGQVIVLSIASTTLENQDEQMTKDVVLKYIYSQEYTYPILFDNDGMVWQAYKQDYIPANYFIDTHGDIQLLYVNAFENESVLYSALEAVRRADSGQ